MNVEVHKLDRLLLSRIIGLSNSVREASRMSYKSLPCFFKQSEVMLPRTVGRRDAAVERTGMYSQRVLGSITSFCES